MEEIKKVSNIMLDAHGYIKDTELESLFRVAKESNTRNYAFLKVLALTGRRVSEVVRGDKGYGIKVKDIDFDSRIVTYRILKKNPRKKDELDTKPKPEPSEVMLECNAELIEILRLYCDGKKPEQYLFPFTRQRARQIITAIGKKAGIEYVGRKPLHPHHFRHTFAVRMARQDDFKVEDLVDLQDHLQHSDLRMTSHYLKFGKTRSREHLDKL